jgi:hypothetical protein
MFCSAAANAQEPGDLEKCAQLEDPQARLECYDTVSQRRPAAEPPAAVPEPEVSTEPEQPEQLSDAVGEEQLESKEVKEGPVQGRLTECRKGPTGKWYFYFDNGQVWEQRDNDRLHSRECDFDVTISKDFFGYKMTLPDSDNKIRVARVK